MDCRMGCGACCIAPSIKALDKPAGVRCQHLTDEMLCAVFGRSERPQACGDFVPEMSVCGTSRNQALNLITELEILTSP